MIKFAAVLFICTHSGCGDPMSTGVIEDSQPGCVVRAMRWVDDRELRQYMSDDQFIRVHCSEMGRV